MNAVLQGLTIIAALLFLGVSATMNALFLSSLGRSSLEIALLGAVSLAGDMSKAVLPVLMVRAVSLRAWGNAAAATLLLVGVTILSLASGTGFSALMRDAATATRGAHSERIASIRQELREIETRLAAMTGTRGAEIIDADLAALHIDRRWQASNFCAEANSVATRQFCGEVLRLQAELAAARDRDRLTIKRQTTRRSLEALQAQGASTDDDPQALVLGRILGLDAKAARVVLTSWMAVILELGSVIMLLLAAGPALGGWRARGIPEASPLVQPSPLIPAELPVQPDRLHWRRQRAGMTFGGTTGRIESHVGK